MRERSLLLALVSDLATAVPVVDRLAHRVARLDELDGAATLLNTRQT